MESASKIIGQVASGSRAILEAEQIACTAWTRAVGRRLAAHTRAVKLVRGRLVIEVEDQTWRSNLSGLSRFILSNIAKTIGPDVVTDLEFRVVPPRRQAQRAATLAAPSDDAEMIADPVLRRVYKSARRRETA